MKYYDTIRELAAAAAPSGFEAPALRIIEEKVRGLEVHKNALGSLFVHRPGPGKRVLLAAPADTAGVIVTDVDEKGFARLGLLGHYPPADLIGLPLRFTDGRRGIVGVDGGVEVKDVKARHLFADLAAPGGLRPGACAVADLPTYEEGGRVISPALENRAACAVLLDVLARTAAMKLSCDLTVAFLTQHALGARGAGPAAYTADPDTAIAVELCPASDTPGSPLRTQVRLGGGPVLPLVTGKSAADPALAAQLEQWASGPVQRAVYAEGESALGTIQANREGVTAAVVGIPARRWGFMAQAAVSDMEGAVELLCRALEGLA